jgi:hypothetical protein
MFKRMSAVAIVLCLELSVSAQCQDKAGMETEPYLYIDIPTKLDRANVVIDFGHVVFGGDLPFALGDIHLLSNDLRDWNTTGQAVVIFHGDAAYLSNAWSTLLLKVG